jgi:hypothetical protein
MDMYVVLMVGVLVCVFLGCTDPANVSNTRAHTHAHIHTHRALVQPP